MAERLGDCIKRLEDGNERVHAVEVLAGDTSLCIINAYLPTPSLPSSRESYLEMLSTVLCTDIQGRIKLCPVVT